MTDYTRCRCGHELHEGRCKVVMTFGGLTCLCEEAVPGDWRGAFREVVREFMRKAAAINALKRRHERN